MLWRRFPDDEYGGQIILELLKLRTEAQRRHRMRHVRHCVSVSSNLGPVNWGLELRSDILC